MINKKDWKSSKINIQDNSIAGKGMFANQDIKEGEELIVFGGDYVDKKQAEEYIKKGKLVMHWDDNLYSYEDKGNEEGYFINHSCDPNMWMVDAHTLVAREDIKKGKELNIDYALWEAREDYISRWNCKCGSNLCRGRVTGKDWRDPELQERYKNHFSPLLNKRIESHTAHTAD